jgi:hypothetical protein
LFNRSRWRRNAAATRGAFLPGESVGHAWPSDDSLKIKRGSGSCRCRRVAPRRPRRGFGLPLEQHIWMRWRSAAGSFHRSAVFSRRPSALLHLTICFPRIRWRSGSRLEKNENRQRRKCGDRESEVGRYVAREARADKVGSRDRGSQLAKRDVNAIVCGWSAEAGGDP